MDGSKERKWYKKKRYIIPLAIAGLLAINGSGNQVNQNSSSIQTSSVIEATLPQEKTINRVGGTKINVAETPSNTTLSNDNHYTNSVGNTVHSPAYTSDNSIPSGASAQCRDGTYSFSQSRRGTCSHHGGVAKWL